MRSRRSDHKGKEEFWRPIFLRYRESGLSCRAFCEREGFRCSLFGFWRRKFEKQSGTFRSQRTDEEWTEVIENALRHPPGILAYLKKERIDKKTFYKKFSQLKSEHPQWGARPKKSKYAGTHSKPKVRSKTAVPPFAEVRVTTSETVVNPRSNVVELILPNSITIKLESGCPLDYVSSLLSVLENR